MLYNLSSFVIFLSILWFFVYWILGGVLFALLTILRLGRVKKVRFSCLFTILSAACGFGAAYYGMQYAQESVSICVSEAVNRAQTVAAVFGCGFSGVFGAFLIGAAILTFGGFVILAISKSKAKPWIVLEEAGEVGEVGEVREGKSKFF